MGEKESIEVESLELVVFKCGGFMAGADMEQISAIVSVEEAINLGVSIVSLAGIKEKSEKFAGLDESSKVLLIKNSVSRDKVRGIVAERLEDIFNVKLDCLMPLPPLLERSKARDIFWVVANIDSGEYRNVLVADLDRLK